MSEKMIGVTIRMPESVWHVYYEQALKTRQHVSVILTQFLLKEYYKTHPQETFEAPATLHRENND